MSGPYPDRRELLALSAAAAFGASAAAGASRPFKADDKVSPRKRYAFKKSINLWAFPYPEKMNLEQCLRLAKEAGFDGIELNYDLDNDLSPKSGPKEYAKIRDMAEKIGIAISGLCSFLFWPYPLTSNDPAKRARGLELAGNPQLALAWANELTQGPGRTAVMEAAAVSMVGSDPASAFALMEQVPENERSNFFAGIFSGWAEKDTDAALKYHDELGDPADQAAALAAIRSVAPVGIGAALAIKDGYPVINQVLPGTPAQLSGQLQPGDRIVALAQGDNSFVDMHSVALSDVVNMVRGAPGTSIQLQVLPADAAPGSIPRTVVITRDQLKFKN